MFQNNQERDMTIIIAAFGGWFAAILDFDIIGEL